MDGLLSIVDVNVRVVRSSGGCGRVEKGAGAREQGSKGARERVGPGVVQN